MHFTYYFCIQRWYFSTLRIHKFLSNLILPKGEKLSLIVIIFEINVIVFGVFGKRFNVFVSNLSNLCKVWIYKNFQLAKTDELQKIWANEFYSIKMQKKRIWASQCPWMDSEKYSKFDRSDYFKYCAQNNEFSAAFLFWSVVFFEKEFEVTDSNWATRRIQKHTKSSKALLSKREFDFVD